MEKLIGALFMLFIIALVIGALAGIGYLGYQENGITGAVLGVLIAAIFLYQIGAFLFRTIALPATNTAIEVLKRMEAEGFHSGIVRVSKRHKGKFHRVKFRCERCGMDNSIRQTIDEMYTFMCVRCSFPHRVVYKSWFSL